ncbi:MAG: BON domain-containing protein [Desulfotignum sp.]
MLLCVLFFWGCSHPSDPNVYSRYQQKPRTVPTVVEDTLIAARVKAALSADPLVQAKAITVKVRHGVVFLTGTAKDKACARMAAQLVRGITGVIRVENQISAD